MASASACGSRVSSRRGLLATGGAGELVLGFLDGSAGLGERAARRLEVVPDRRRVVAIRAAIAEISPASLEMSFL
jgi:hypothetical protein